MPLSEHEEQILAEIERQLSADDPRFVARARRVGARGADRAMLVWSSIGFLVGLTGLLMLTFHIAFGFAGFALMLVSVLGGQRALQQMEHGDDDALVDRLKRAFTKR